MKCNTFKTKGRAVIAASLLTGGMSIASTGQAGCELVIDPFLSNVMGMPVEAYMGHPCAQPHPGPSIQTESDDGLTTFVVTPEGQHAPQDPFLEPPGSNFLMTVYEDARDLSNRVMPNTLPSTPTNPYNLHDGPVLTSAIDKTNPEDDLDAIIDRLEAGGELNRNLLTRLATRGVDILEGNPIDRAYSGFPMLHYNGPKKVSVVEPIFDANGVVIGGNVDVNMIFFNQHIESDTAFIDPSAVLEVPYTVTYNVNVLNRGIEDFSPMTMNFNRIINPVTGEDMRGPFHVSMDKSFFPMLNEGTRYTIKVKENKGKYFNLTYTWGWRIHPPRVQVAENALKTAGPNGWTLPEWEKAAFCSGGAKDPDCDPVANADDRAFAISQIGELSPAKRMWTLFNQLLAPDARMNLRQITADLRVSFLDWLDRTKLPTGVTADPDATLTLLYVNNTLYGNRQGLSGDGSKLGPASYKGIGNGSAHEWNVRPYVYKTTLLNGDKFPHGYMNVDFGGSRGWENHFQTTDPTTAVGPHPVIPPDSPANGEPYTNPANIVDGEENIYPINRGGVEEFLQPTARNLTDPINGDPQLGSGCFFTFGRNHAWPNAGGPWGGIMVPPVAADGTPGLHKVEITFNFEPSRRLKIYQFDPLHHDIAIYSLH
ncbi:hypothetical protein MNBD_GAMMA22-43 [hydrothermal vent metagenome]|uniref:Uncharacterized protein n=1 Tax=hydrothermal vent metagenome TaxID=652676 RepID=A0A3B1A5H0_9ZZZZ